MQAPVRRIIPMALGLGMLAVVVAAALAPNAGVAQASSGCSYNQCTTASSPFPWWAISAIVVIILAALIGALLLMRRRRRQPPAAAPPMQAYDAGPAAGGGAGGAGAAPVAGGAAAPYVEGPEDVGEAPPEPTAGPGVPPAGATGSEPDIDSLMAELDKISGEILKRTPKKPGDTSGSQGSTPDADDDPSS